MSEETSLNPAESIRLKKRLDREKKARLEAEEIAERGTRQLYQKQQEIELLHKVAAASNEAETIDQAIQIAIDSVCAYTGWPVGHAFVREEISGELLSSPVWHLKNPESFESFRVASETIRFRSGIGLPGRVLVNAEPVWMEDVTHDSNFSRARHVQNLGIRGGFAFPVLVGKEVVAVLEFYSSSVAIPNISLLEAMSHIGMQLGRVIERKRYERELQVAKETAEVANRAKSEFLAQILGRQEPPQIEVPTPFRPLVRRALSTLLPGNHAD